MPESDLPFDVFLSYKSEDEPWVRGLKDALVEKGLKVWLDEDEIVPGDRIVEALERGLDSSHAVALIITPESLASGWVQDEYHRAETLSNDRQRNLRLIPVLLRVAKLPGFLGNRKWVDFTDESGFQESVDRLYKGISKDRVRNVPAAVPPPTVSLGKLPRTGPDLFGREPELELLDRAWEDPDTRIVTLIAFGGVGKTALVNHWLEGMGRDHFRGARQVYGWSFYSQGTKENYGSADQFIDAALRHFGDADPTSGSSWDKGIRLAQLIRKQTTLLVLDGIEPLQWGPGPNLGQLRDRAGGMYALLRELSYGMEGLCVISSRVELTDLPGSDEHGPVRRRDLENLSPEAGRSILRQDGVQGTDEELEAAVAEYSGYALSLVLLGQYLKEFLGGDISRRDQVPALHAETTIGGHAERVMDAYDAALLRDERHEDRQVLRVLGLFDRPASKGVLDALRQKPAVLRTTTAIVKMTENDWRETIGRLRRWKLVTPASSPDDGSLDAHPLVREYFAQKLRGESEKGFRLAHGRLYDHLCAATKEFPDTLAEMEPLFQAVQHGCRAGKHAHALEEVYRDRIQRGNEFYCAKKLGALGAEVAALSAFFERTWSDLLPGFSDGLRGYLFNAAGSHLRSLGRMGEAVQPLQAGVDMAVAARWWGQAAAATRNLCGLHIASGDLALAEETARKAAELAEKAGTALSQDSSMAYQGYAHHQRGELLTARPLFEGAECLQQEIDPKESFLYSLRGAQYCALLLDVGSWEEVRRRAAQTLNVAERNRWLLDIGLDHLSHGRACQHLAAADPEAPSAGQLLEEAQEHLDLAVRSLREAGRQDYLTNGLLARTAFLREVGRPEEALRDLQEAMQASTQCGFRLHETDARLLEGHFALDEASPDLDKAQTALDRATTLIAQTGYHLRDADLLILEGRLLAKKGDVAEGRGKLEEAIRVAKREEAEGAVYQLAVMQAERYLGEEAKRG